MPATAPAASSDPLSVLSQDQRLFAPQAWSFSGAWASNGAGAITETDSSKDTISLRLQVPEGLRENLVLSFDMAVDDPAPGKIWVVVTARGGEKRDVLRTNVDPATGHAELALADLPEGTETLDISLKRTLNRGGDLTLSDVDLTAPPGAWSDGADDGTGGTGDGTDTGDGTGGTDTGDGTGPGGTDGGDGGGDTGGDGGDGGDGGSGGTGGGTGTGDGSDGGSGSGTGGTVASIAAPGSLDFNDTNWSYSGAWTASGGSITETEGSKGTLSTQISVPEGVTTGLTLSFHTDADVWNPGALWIVVSARGGEKRDVLRAEVDPDSGRVELPLGDLPDGTDTLILTMKRTLNRNGDVTISDLDITAPAPEGDGAGTGGTDGGTDTGDGTGGTDTGDGTGPGGTDGGDGGDGGSGGTGDDTGGGDTGGTGGDTGGDGSGGTSPYGSMYFFGNSLTDAAYSGRFTQTFEGAQTANWADMVPVLLNATYEPTQYYNYAIGGAQTGRTNVLTSTAERYQTEFGIETGLLAQIDRFEANVPVVADNDIAAVWIGTSDIWASAKGNANDWFHAPLGVKPDVADLTDYMMDNITSGVQRLIDSGFEKILLMSTYDVASSDNLGNSASKARGTEYSEAVTEAMSHLSFEGTTVYFHDSLQLLRDVQADAASYGFTHTDGANNLAALGGPDLTLEQQNEFIFADAVHFTNGYNRIVAEKVAELILTTDGFDFVPPQPGDLDLIV